MLLCLLLLILPFTVVGMMEHHSLHGAPGQVPFSINEFFNTFICIYFCDFSFSLEDSNGVSNPSSFDANTDSYQSLFFSFYFAHCSDFSFVFLVNL